jgi:hypothetical protein
MTPAVVRTATVQAAATRLSHTETISTIWLAAGFTIPTATIAMITGRCLWRDARAAAMEA